MSNEPNSISLHKPIANLDLSMVLKHPTVVSVQNDGDFYFEKGRQALREWLNLVVSEDVKSKLIALSSNYNKILEEAQVTVELREALDKIFEVIAYCDNHARDKNKYNKYDDNRALADAFVRMNVWTEKLIQFKFSNQDIDAGSPRNAFSYLLDPINQSSILSENHRKLVSENLIGKMYNPNEFVSNLKEFFDGYNLATVNLENYTHLLMWVVYSMQEKWKEEVIGLVASDGTGWQEDFLSKIDDYEAGVVWNSKKPTGTNETIKFLRAIIADGREFPLYYNVRGNVLYKANIIDFAESEEEYKQKNWRNNSRILWLEDKFSDYRDDNKSAKIVFLVGSMENVESMSISAFEFYKSYKSPTQDNLSPIKNIKIMPEQNSLFDLINQIKEILKQDPSTEDLFSFQKSRINFVWIADKYGKIGDWLAHYEVIRRKDKIFVEIHFEGKNNTEVKDQFAQRITALPNKTKWFDWDKSKSIAYVDEFLPSDPECAKKIAEALVYLENNLGDPVRQILDNINDHRSESSYSLALNQILYGPPGTGKTYNTVNKAIRIANPKFDLNCSRDEIKAEYDRLITQGQIVFTTFHQSMSYEDFIEGIKPLKPMDADTFVKYDVVPGIFKKACLRASTPSNVSFEIAYGKLLQDLELKGEIELKSEKLSFKIVPSENAEDLGVISTDYIKNITKEGLVYVSKSKRFIGVWGQYYKVLFRYMEEQYGYKESVNRELKNHVIIIDEINRGNVSQIFGELITLIEEDKRAGQDEALEVTLPYSKDKFSVPSNLYIIGTMNTADRSVEALDTALRRRFHFEEMSSRPSLIASNGKLKEQSGVLEGIDLVALLEKINRRIVKLIDNDHQIGHSYFMAVANLGDLKIAFQNKIIPLLQEYFFGDFGKAGLVLGKEFFEPIEDDVNKVFAEFNGYDSSGFEERVLYKTRNVLKMEKDEFISAVKTLMK